MKALVGPSRGLLRYCTTSPINRFAALIISPAANLFDADGFPLRAELEPLGPVLGPEDGAVLQLAEALLLQHGQDEHAALQVLAQQVLVHLAQEIFVVPETSWYTYLHVVNKCFK